MERHDMLEARGRISGTLRALRKGRGFTQADLALRLGLGQGRYSRIEHGTSSLSAEQFLEVLRIFNVSASVFQSGEAPGGDIQNALIRFGAAHLLGDPSRLPDDRFARAEDVFREVLSDGSQARHLAALAPVFVKHHADIRLKRLWASFVEAGLEGRLGWALENTLEAVRQGRPRRSLSQNGSLSRGAEHDLEAFLDWAEPRREKAASEAAGDLLGLKRAGPKSRQEIAASASPSARRWCILTRLTPADFLAALKAADVAH